VADQVRNVVLVGHSGTGKSSLVEALLAATGTIQRPGSIEEGTTVSDFDPLEKSWQHSLRSSVLNFDIDGTRIHLIDTPGFPDFIGQAIGALDASTCSTRPATPTSRGTSGPGSARPTRRCSPSPPPRGSTA